MNSHLNNRQYYENIYDRVTVSIGRRGMATYEGICHDMSRETGKDFAIPENALMVNFSYMICVGNTLVERYLGREEGIRQNIALDEARDQRLATAQLKIEPYCRHCNKRSMCLLSKTLTYDSVPLDSPLSVLFIFNCSYCPKRTAFHEDGSIYKTVLSLCPECNTEMDSAVKNGEKATIMTDTCSSCQYTETHELPYTEEDPDYEKDRRYYCLCDEDFRHMLMRAKEGLAGINGYISNMQEFAKERRMHIAVGKIQMSTISEVLSLLTIQLAKAKFAELSFDKPNIGRYVTVAFSCLDGKTGRRERESRKALKATITEALKNTNWRLTSGKIKYRLGCMTGKLRAHESEDELKLLARDNPKLMKINDEKTELPKEGAREFTAPNGRRLMS